MSQPTVVAIMLVNGRPEMVRRAIKSFREQAYFLKHLLILDTSPGVIPGSVGVEDIDEHQTGAKWTEEACDRSIGLLRNRANGLAALARNLSEVIVHWDSDDWSHPNRIAEQVALLQSSGKQCVGYRDMLFWKQDAFQSYTSKHPDDCRCGTCGPGQRTVVVGEHDLGTAWLYSNPDTSYCLGTSLCYWREVWERRPFPDLPKAKGGSGEDVEWLRGVDSLGESSLAAFTAQAGRPGKVTEREFTVPRMIASTHGGNTQYYGSDLLERSTSWKRAPEWNAYCRERMAL